MARYSKKASENVEEKMHERKRGKLRSGSGRKVTSRKQAIAIALSESRRSGEKVPKKKSSGRKKSTSARKKSGGRKKTSGARKTTRGKRSAKKK